MSRHHPHDHTLAHRLHRTASSIRGLVERESVPRHLKEQVSAWANTCDQAAARLEATPVTSTAASVGQDAARARRLADRLHALTSRGESREEFERDRMGETGERLAESARVVEEPPR